MLTALVSRIHADMLALHIEYMAGHKKVALSESPATPLKPTSVAASSTPQGHRTPERRELNFLEQLEAQSQARKYWEKAVNSSPQTAKMWAETIEKINAKDKH